ncbi:MAG: GDP-mannose 4,6-dehydratase [Chloroflexi bacterium]|nr:GDP-mannose 4,6-dehydratase [Chloroflexota bacterium]
MGKVQRVLITGVTGFAGSHLADYINKLGGIEVFGTVRPRSSTENIESPVTLLQCDLTDPQSVAKAMAQSLPDIVFHLAAQSFVPMSFVAPSMTMQANLQGTLNILEAVRASSPETVIHFAGTSEEYGHVLETELPIAETQQFRPMSQYAVSKIAGEYLCHQYATTYNMPIAISRAFNHTGPRRGSMFATSNFALQIALIEAGRQEPVICVGNLDTRRDFSDVRDVVRAYWQLANAGLSTEPYNICSEQDLTLTMSPVNSATSARDRRPGPSCHPQPTSRTLGRSSPTTCGMIISQSCRPVLGPGRSLLWSTLISRRGNPFPPLFARGTYGP